MNVHELSKPSRVASLLLVIVLFVIACMAGAAFDPAKADGPQTKSSRPVIAVNTSISGETPEESSVESHYIDAIRKCGGIPVLLPPMPAEDLAEVMANVDGVMMIGGADYPPALYHQDTQHHISLMKDSRINFDMELARAVLAEKTLPFLGICAGCQALNISAGGSLLQDIPDMKPESTIKHASPPDGWKNGFNKHSVEITAGSKLAKTLGKTELLVITSHHQCVDKPGAGLTVTARAADGVPEAIETTGPGFVIGVQWHPERDFASNHKLFEELVQQAKLHREARFKKTLPCEKR